MNFLTRVDNRIAELEKSKRMSENEKRKLENLLKELGKRAELKSLVIILATTKEGSIMVLPGGKLKFASGEFKKGHGCQEDWTELSSIEMKIKEEYWENTLIANILKEALREDLEDEKDEVNVHLYFMSPEDYK